MITNCALVHPPLDKITRITPILYFSARLIRAGAWNAYLPVLLQGRLLRLEARCASD
jgi:hypothetical protein